MKTGDVVRQFGSDVLMTVGSTVAGKQRVWCMWFVGSDLHKDWFPISELEVATWSPVVQ